MRLALFEPDIPQNAGTMIRMAACLEIGVDVIEPCGFIFDDKRLRRAGMDYLARAAITRHDTWEAFVAARQKAGGRLILLTTRAQTTYTEFAFDAADTIIVGRESAGAPDSVHEAVDATLRIPMAAGERSLNVALSAAMVVGEALRQTGNFP
ncbi:MAG: tRNA (cytidine(34)-2'-O)-methyltransferase [Rhodospirillales bacterium]|jgi:tRNA (cytidine/uridine-2'-O-)-methyltransferase|nr:tRNA (cytidine(34)-2'-O)-methyltransferase [Rhodospirillales bacterium]